MTTSDLNAVRSARLFEKKDDAPTRKVIFQQVLKKLESRTSSNVKYLSIFIKVCKFGMLPKGEQQSALLDDSGIGFLLFATKAFPDFPDSFT